jgi:galactokinase
MREQLQQEFLAHYGKEHQFTYFSPGRVNLIGEHIDYNGGLVMPCAVTLGTYLLITPNYDGVFRFKSINFKETAEIEVGSSNAKKRRILVQLPNRRYRTF